MSHILKSMMVNARNNIIYVVSTELIHVRNTATYLMIPKKLLDDLTSIGSGFYIRNYAIIRYFCAVDILI
ncbi:hypothetical protein FKM82_013205 [Ascaphus truei]